MTLTRRGVLLARRRAWKPRPPRWLALGLLAALLVFAQRLNAAGAQSVPFVMHVYYVSEHGTDAGLCSLDFPCASLRFASNLTQPGDVVIVRPGIYGPQIVEANGTVDRPIMVIAPGSVTLTRPQPASDALQGTPLLEVVNSTYTIVSGFTVIGMKGRPDYQSKDAPPGGDVVLADGVSRRFKDRAPGTGDILRDLVVEHVNNTCVKTQNQQSGVIIADNTVIDCGSPATHFLDHGIYVSGPNTLISGNTVIGSTGYGIQVYGDKIGDDSILNNVITGSYMGGIIVGGPGPNWGGPRATISGNLIYGNRFGIEAHINMTIANNIVALNTVDAPAYFGFGLLLNGVGPGVGQNSVYNNDFYANNGEIHIGDPIGPLTIRNNIFYGTGNPSDVVLNVIPEGSIIDHNLSYRAPVKPGMRDFFSTLGDPLFANPGIDFRLATGSPAIGAGTTLELPQALPSNDLGAICSCDRLRGQAAITRRFR